MVKFSENDRDDYGKVLETLYEFTQVARAVIEDRLNTGIGKLHLVRLTIRLLMLTRRSR